MDASFADQEQLLRKAGVWKKVLWFSIAGCIAAPILGIGGTVLGMMRAFDTMGMSGGSDPEILAENISLALLTTLGGAVLVIPSVILLIVSLCVLHRLKQAAAAPPVQ
ncbi:MAG: MotA/TolQ/ExbB proton channel family protein [Verrucomicrobiales bacterium]|nr:MotA/TolQ/ExbB proton channel family protein [Verrucomicrobiales bacterium]